ncbi:hypothetical protein [Xanthomonas phage JGB6]|nr:hypothetical protein [Xanthomonas phage JGB6]
MVYENDKYIGLQAESRLREAMGPGFMSTGMGDIMSSTIVMNGVHYPGIMLMGLIKAYFDQLYTERLNAQDATDRAAAEALAEQAAIDDAAKTEQPAEEL